MTKTDFAELKEKLCAKPEIEFDISTDVHIIPTKDAKELVISAVTCQHESDAAIISELIEIIQSQSEALDMSATRDDSLHYRINPKCNCLWCDQKQALSETTARLQKLRDGI